MIKIDTLILLVDKFGLSLESVPFVKGIELPLNLECAIKECDYKEVLKISEELQNDLSCIDELRLFATWLKKESHFQITCNSTSELDDEEDEEFEINTEIEAPDYLSEEEKVIWLKDYEERSNARTEHEKRYLKNSSRIKKWTQEETNQDMISFFYKESPQFTKGFSRSLFASTRTLYYKSLGIYFYSIPDSVQERFIKAEEFCKCEIEKRFREFEEGHIDVWKNEIEQRAVEQGITRITKSYIKEFFKSLEIKASMTTIDRIKSSIDI